MWTGLYLQIGHSNNSKTFNSNVSLVQHAVGQTQGSQPRRLQRGRPRTIWNSIQCYKQTNSSGLILQRRLFLREDCIYRWKKVPSLQVHKPQHGNSDQQANKNWEHTHTQSLTIWKVTAKFQEFKIQSFFIFCFIFVLRMRKRT